MLRNQYKAPSVYEDLRLGRIPRAFFKSPMAENKLKTGTADSVVRTYWLRISSDSWCYGGVSGVPIGILCSIYGNHVNEPFNIQQVEYVNELEKLVDKVERFSNLPFRFP